MITNCQLNSTEIKYIEFILSYFECFQCEIIKQINESKVEREEHPEHLFLYLSVSDSYEKKVQLPFSLTLGVSCKDGNNVDLKLWVDNTTVSEIEVFSNIMLKLNCDAICNGIVYWKSISYKDGRKTVWTLDEKNQQLQLEVGENTD